MAISKILYIGDCGAGYSGKHLKQALDYITVREKTGGGRWIGALNCQPGNVYEQMRQTKELFGKTDQRQGYHLIISFAEGEVDADTAFEVIGKFAKEYLGADYETMYAVHDNTEHIHGHLIFNSVSFRTGTKYRYKKGDWAKQIQPITNRLCEEYGLSTIEISEDRAKPSENYKEWNDFRDGKFVWADMIKRDLDGAILQSSTYESFLETIKEMGYEVKNAYCSEGKYLAIKPMGMTRFRRCKNFGENYCEERIQERILTENISAYQSIQGKMAPKIVTCRMKQICRAKLSGVQKRYFAKLYRTGQLKKRPYSQAWRYRDDIRRMDKLQEDYFFLSRHEIRNITGIFAVKTSMTDKKREVSREKSRIFKERARMKPLFHAAEQMEELQECENCYQRGESLFLQEHKQWQAAEEKIKKEGYGLEQIAEFREHYRREIARIREKEKAVAKEEKIAGRILKELLAEQANRKSEEKQELDRKKKCTKKVKNQEEKKEVSRQP